MKSWHGQKYRLFLKNIFKIVLLLGKVILFMPSNHKKAYTCTAAMLFKRIQQMLVANIAVLISSKFNKPIQSSYQKLILLREIWNQGSITFKLMEVKKEDFMHQKMKTNLKKWVKKSLRSVLNTWRFVVFYTDSIGIPWFLRSFTSFWCILCGNKTK